MCVYICSCTLLVDSVCQMLCKKSWNNSVGLHKHPPLKDAVFFHNWLWRNFAISGAETAGILWWLGLLDVLWDINSHILDKSYLSLPLCVSFPHYPKILFDLAKSSYALQWVSQSLPFLIYTSINGLRCTGPLWLDATSRVYSLRTVREVLRKHTLIKTAVWLKQ